MASEIVRIQTKLKHRTGQLKNSDSSIAFKNSLFHVQLQKKLINRNIISMTKFWLEDDGCKLASNQIISAKTA